MSDRRKDTARLRQEARKASGKTASQFTSEPVKVTPEVREIICNMLRKGHFLVTALARAGVSRNALRIWRERAAQDEEPYASFMAEIEKAKAEGEDLHVSNLVRAGETDWRASQFLLKQRWAKRWGEKETKVKLSGSVDIRQDLADVLDKISEKQKPDDDGGDAGE